jgi:hypothetical protein
MKISAKGLCVGLVANGRRVLAIGRKPAGGVIVCRVECEACGFVCVVNVDQLNRRGCRRCLKRRGSK